VAVGEHDDRAARGGPFELGDEAVAAGHHLAQTLTAGTAVEEQVPPRMPLVDLRRGQPLVRAVVVLGQRIDDGGLDTGNRSMRGLQGTLQGTAEHQWQSTLGESCQQGRQPVGLVSTLLRQGQIGATGVAAVVGPFGRAMAHEQDEGRARRGGFRHDFTP